MAVSQQISVRQSVYLHKETTNQSFVDMHYYLSSQGRTNNAFFLILYDRGLASVNPRDENLSLEMKFRIINECRVNYWYFLREVVRVPGSGDTTGLGMRYQLHRGNMAMGFMFQINFNQFVELPRQFGKTTAALCRYLWCYQFGTTNSEIMFLHKDHAGSKKNLRDLKIIRDMLPSYLQISSAVGADGKKLKVQSNVITAQHPLNGNRIVTFASARNEGHADGMGRGCTQPLQYYDEFAFMPYNWIVYKAATPANSKASETAALHHAPHGILITTTPGDVINEAGAFAYQVRNQATPFSERYYDLTYPELLALRKSNKNNNFFMISFSYLQLGRGEDYFEKMCVDLMQDWDKIRREVLLEWSTSAGNCPFREEDLEIVKTFCRDPISTLFFGRFLQYQFNIYEKMDPRVTPIIGVDVSGAMYQDSSAITVVDSSTTKVTATLNCNFIPSDDLADVIYEIVTKYMPNAVVNIERNGGFGLSVIQRLVKTSIKKNLFYEIKDQVTGESWDGIRMKKIKQKVRVYGLNSSKQVRARLIEILFERMNYHKDKFVAPILHDELKSMETKKGGKVEHSDKTHDDQVFSYLMAMYVWYDGTNLAERYGIQKNMIATDEGKAIEALTMDTEELDATEKVDIDSMINDDLNDMIVQQVEVLKESAKSKLASEFILQQALEDQRSIQAIGADPVMRKAYIEKYHIDPESTFGVFDDPNIYTTIPDDVFDLDADVSFDITGEDMDLPQDHIVGNLAEAWRSLR